MNSQIAAFILELVNVAPVTGRDAENVVSAKQWLRQIQSGQLVVGKPEVEEAKPIAVNPE